MKPCVLVFVKTTRTYLIERVARGIRHNIVAAVVAKEMIDGRLVAHRDGVRSSERLLVHTHTYVHGPHPPHITVARDSHQYVAVVTGNVARIDTQVLRHPRLGPTSCHKIKYD